MTYASTLENSLDGDTTKLSFVFDHEMRCCILGSSSMLHRHDQSAMRRKTAEEPPREIPIVLVELMDERRLHQFGLLSRRGRGSSCPDSRASGQGIGDARLGGA